MQLNDMREVYVSIKTTGNNHMSVAKKWTAYMIKVTC